MNDSYNRIRQDLELLGIVRGDVLVVHSSLKSMGYVEGGAACVIDALSDAIGKEGTLMFPTFTYRTSYVDSFYSNKETPSCVGLISETFRHADGVIRTNHPTHSVAIRGRLAYDMIQDEEVDDTPMGPRSPYRRLPSVNAKILMLGCGTAHNSFMHAVEEEANAVYSLRDHQTYTVVDAQGRIGLRRVRRHNFARADGTITQRYDRAIDVLDIGDYSCGSVCGAASVWMDSVALKAKALKKMREFPLYFVDDPNGYYPEYRTDKN